MASATDDTPELERLRRAIDAVDDELLAALNRRAALVKDVASWKQAHGRPFYVPSRERSIIERLQARNPGPFPTVALAVVYAEIMSACLSLEERLKVSFLGPEATFTHQAARTRFGLSAVYFPAASIAGVFADVEKGRVELGVVPIESSTEGMVSATLDALVGSELVIAQEIVAPGEYCLVTRAAVLSDVERVHATAQALAQCRGWLSAKLPGCALVEVGSAAEAARHARDDPASAALATELAARLHDLRVVERRIEDRRAAVNRFFVVARSSDPTPGAPLPTGRDKSSLLFTLPDEPGALQHALAALSEARINLTRIESRPLGRPSPLAPPEPPGVERARTWEYVFFIDIDRHVGEPAVAQALATFRSRCARVKVLGSYPSAEEAGG